MTKGKRRSRSASSSSQDVNAGQAPQSQDSAVLMTIQDPHGVFGNVASAQVLSDAVETLQNQGANFGNLKQVVSNAKGLPEQVSEAHREKIKKYRSSEDPHLKPLQEVEDRSQIEPDSIEENESTAT